MEYFYYTVSDKNDSETDQVLYREDGLIIEWHIWSELAGCFVSQSIDWMKKNHFVSFNNLQARIDLEIEKKEEAFVKASRDYLENQFMSIAKGEEAK